MSQPEEHYLKTELYTLIKHDERIFDFIQQGSLDGIFYYDLERPDQEWLSPRFKEVFGYEDHEIDNSPEWWQANMVFEDKARMLAALEAHIINPEQPMDEIVRYRHKDGSTVWIRCRGMAIRDEDGTPLRVLGAHTDVTEIKRAEEQLREVNAELQRSNRDLDHFAAVTSAEFKIPLRGLRNLSNLLDQALVARGGDEHILGLTHRMAERLDEMERLLDGMLTYARFTSLGGHDQIAELDPATLIMEIWEQLGASASCRLVMPDELPMMTVPGAPLRQVFFNILQSAVEHIGSEGGTVEIRARVIGHRIHFNVIDDGQGMDDASLYEVYRHQRSDDRLGLEMALVRRLVERVGGLLSLRPVGVEGVCASFDWPLRRLQ